MTDKKLTNKTGQELGDRIVAQIKEITLTHEELQTLLAYVTHTLLSDMKLDDDLREQYIVDFYLTQMHVICTLEEDREAEHDR